MIDATEALQVIGLSIGAGIGGVFVGDMRARRKAARMYGAERRRDNTPALVDKAVRVAMAESMELHLGTKNGEIKENMERIRQTMANLNAFMTVSCPAKHEGVTARLNAQEDALRQFRDSLQ